jgi:hypothetical protein
MDHEKPKEYTHSERDFRVIASPYLTAKVLEKMDKEGIRKKPELLNQLLTKWVKELT